VTHSAADADRGTDPAKLLRIYLDDHWAGAGAGRSLARRLAEHNRDTEWFDTLQRVTVEIERDHDTLGRLRSSTTGAGFSLKRTLAKTAEFVGRLKLNGRLVDYSPSSRVLELEALIAGVQAKRLLWIALRRSGAFKGEADFEELERRALEQLDQLRPIHAEAASLAFADRHHSQHH
jgi:hypothetical protein